MVGPDEPAVLEAIKHTLPPPEDGKDINDPDWWHFKPGGPMACWAGRKLPQRGEGGSYEPPQPRPGARKGALLSRALILAFFGQK